MSAVPVAAAARHILIAEDSPTQAQKLRHILEEQGYRVTVAANGRLALEAAVRDRPALVVSDVVMPEMTGYELCRRVKEDPRLSDVPVVLVTTLSDPQDVILGLECRADNFILKPYEADQLLRRIDFVLANAPMRPREPSGSGLEIAFGGQKHVITADRMQILTLLLSTYEAASQRNKELISTRDALRQTNLELEHLTRELEERVRVRTRELEHSNEALRQAQRALIQQERLRALGQMASGIAHDINNAISPVSLYTEMLLGHETGLSATGRERLVTIQRAIEDVAQTIARMREFYRPNQPERHLTGVQLEPLVQQVVELTRVRWSDQPQRRGVMIELKTEVAPELPQIQGADNEIRDALTNLVFNAVDAMPEGGVITVRAGLAQSTASGSTHVTLEVSDTGIGMDEEMQRRCLEPFFTTKGERGTGLGLAMVYGMMQRHGGELAIDSKLGAGTTVRLVFPMVAAATEATVSKPVLEAPAPGLRVLIVDDDPSLRESLSSALEEEGHYPTLAEGGQAGIDAFRNAQQSAEPFHLVITDLGMPHVDGRKVAEAVHAASPHTPIVLLTGWGQTMPEGERPPLVNRVLSKPPRLAELRAALAELSPARASGKDPDGKA